MQEDKIRLEDKRLKMNVPTNWMYSHIQHVYGPTASGSKGGKVFDPQTEKPYGWKIINNCKIPLYPMLFSFDNSDWSIGEYHHQWL